MDFDVKSILGNGFYEHIGWVPCVSGHLDFGKVNVGLHGVFMPHISNGLKGLWNRSQVDKNRDEINFAASGYADSHHRRIVLQSWVDWRDSDRGDGRTRVVVSAEVNPSDSLDERYLKGRILLFPKRYDEEFSTEHKSLMDLVGKVTVSYKSYISSIDPNRPQKNNDLREVCNLHWDALNDRLKSSSPFGKDLEHAYLMDFLITANGFVFIKFVPSGSDEAADGVDPDDAYTACRQAFYYLKYSIHKHKHHGEKADALTTIVPWPSHPYRKTESNDPREAVGLKLIGQLKRELTEIKRARQVDNSPGHATPLGIIGYLRSLINSCKAQELLSPEVANRELAWVDGVTQSFEAQQLKLEKAAVKKEAALQVSRQMVAIFVTATSLLMLSWINLNQKTIRGYTEGKDIYQTVPPVMDWINTKPENFMWVVLAALSAVWVVVKLFAWVSKIDSSSYLRQVKLQRSNMILLAEVLVIITLVSACGWIWFEPQIRGVYVDIVSWMHGFVMRYR